MAILPPLATPSAAWRDLKAFLATRQRHQLLFAALAVAMPVVIIAGFWIDSDPGPPPPMTIYVQNYNGDRPDAVIKAQQKIDQAAKDKAAAERQAMFRKLEQKLGM
jgi:hypothetical protein